MVLSIGAGAMVVSHANDSFFWVITQMSRMDVKTGYKLQSVGTLILGVSAAVILWISSIIFN
jgi:GntP family gluconate:H+ symporter